MPEPFLRSRRPRFLLALLLLVLQAGGAGAVTLAHAADPATPAAAFEAHHTAGCVVLHDAARCALCQYAGVRMPPAGAPTQPGAVDVPTVTRPRGAERTLPRLLHQHRTTPPRAPPATV